MRSLLTLIIAVIPCLLHAQKPVVLKKKDYKRDVLLVTDSGNIVLRLSDSTPLHKHNFLRLAKEGFYDSISFHRVIKSFMIQAGNPVTKGRKQEDSGYTLPAEFRTSLFHQRGALAAARMGDDVNPEKRSSGSQFYIVQGKIFSPAGLDSVETFRLKGRKIPQLQREVYQAVGGAPHLDQNYTVFGQVISGMETVDRIAATATAGRQGGDKPLTDIRIRQARLIRKSKTTLSRG
jgi:peptidyl-prolyl cis-trans isomerase B (cyclophilin B)